MSCRYAWRSVREAPLYRIEAGYGEALATHSQVCRTINCGRDAPETDIFCDRCREEIDAVRDRARRRFVSSAPQAGRRCWIPAVERAALRFVAETVTPGIYTLLRAWARGAAKP